MEFLKYLFIVISSLAIPTVLVILYVRFLPVTITIVGIIIAVLILWWIKSKIVELLKERV